MAGSTQPELSSDPPKEPELPSSLAFANGVLRDARLAGQRLESDGRFDSDLEYVWRQTVETLVALLEVAESRQPARR